MHDPFFLPPIAGLANMVRPLARRWALPSLSVHVHEVVAATLFYTFVQLVVSPAVSTRFFPQYYPKQRGKRANWDAHVVSLVQSTLINVLAIWVMMVDDERAAMDWEQRVWGYTGASAMVQSLAAGYFLWDLMLTLRHVDVFGLGLLAHAVSALTVYSFGFRPFLNYYACPFILYELSTPFLNIHWFFDKLHMTGSRAQLVNGILLLFTFLSCRLIWGTFQSCCMYMDVWHALHSGPDGGYAAAHANTTLELVDNIMAFAPDTPIPTWLGVVYIVSNATLNALNWHWFFKMIAAVRKRFDPVATGKAGRTKTRYGHVDDAGRSTGREPTAGLRRRRTSIEEVAQDFMPDSDDLRDGTIQ